MATPHEKKQSFKARVTVDLQGETKRKFFEEVERTGIKESKLAREIISQHYANNEGKNRF